MYKRKDVYEKIKNVLEKTLYISEKKFLDALNIRGIFHDYSVVNRLMIHDQFENATVVASFNTWKKLNRHVIKDQKGISIFVPVLKSIEIVDENTGETIKKSILRGFNIGHVFDVSQTEGEPLKLFGEYDRSHLVNIISPYLKSDGSFDEAMYKYLRSVARVKFKNEHNIVIDSAIYMAANDYNIDVSKYIKKFALASTKEKDFNGILKLLSKITNVYRDLSRILDTRLNIASA